VHQAGFSLNEYIEIHVQQNIKSCKNLGVFEVQNVCAEELVITGLKIGLSIQMKKRVGYARDILIRSNKMQQYAGIYLLKNYSTSFGCPSHPSSGVHKTVTEASGTGHTI